MRNTSIGGGSIGPSGISGAVIAGPNQASSSNTQSNMQGLKATG